MRTVKSLVAGLITIGLFTIVPSTADESPLLRGAEDLSRQISETYNTASDGHKPKIAVLEFSDLSGRVTDFGRLLSEELITRLFLTQKFEVVERLMLNKVMKEHKLQMEGLVDPNSAKQLGMILGVDAIVSGTCAEIDEGIRVNARIISTETGSVFAAASTTVALPTTTSRAGSSSSTSLLSPGVVYAEDFSGVERGHLPEGWLGPNEVMVYGDAGKRFVASGAPGRYQLFVPTGSFPENFRLSLKVWATDRGNNIGTEQIPVEFVLGNLSFSFWASGKVKCGASNGSFPSVLSSLAIIVIERDAEVVKFMVNGTEALLIRLSQLTPPGGVTIRWVYKRSYDNKWASNGFQLYGIELRRL